jgi:hypothetical protein
MEPFKTAKLIDEFCKMGWIARLMTNHAVIMKPACEPNCKLEFLQRSWNIREEILTKQKKNSNNPGQRGPRANQNRKCSTLPVMEPNRERSSTNPCVRHALCASQRNTDRAASRLTSVRVCTLGCCLKPTWMVHAVSHPIAISCSLFMSSRV